MSLKHSELKARHRAERNQWPESLSLRVHRALSWLARAGRCDDPDGRFIFLWIAFNAAYAAETGAERDPEARRFSDFLVRLVDLDGNALLAGLVWDRYAGAIRTLLDNPFVFQPFWDYANGVPDSGNWESRFQRANAAAHSSLARQDTAAVLGIVFSRLYTLRNQLLHGGATWGGRVNREQLRDGTAVLGDLVPAAIVIMMDRPGEAWGEPCYPVTEFP